MDKNRIKGRRIMMSWHNTAKSFGSCAQVNAAVVQGSIVFLPGEVSVRGLNGFQSTGNVQASVAAMLQTSQTEKSAEGIVVVSKSVSSLRLLGVGEECGKSVRSKARTKEEEATGGDL